MVASFPFNGSTRERHRAIGKRRDVDDLRSGVDALVEKTTPHLMHFMKCRATSHGVEGQRSKVEGPSLSRSTFDIEPLTGRA